MNILTKKELKEVTKDLKALTHRDATNKFAELLIIEEVPNIAVGVLIGELKEAAAIIVELLIFKKENDQLIRSVPLLCSNPGNCIDHIEIEKILFCSANKRILIEALIETSWGDSYKKTFELNTNIEIIISTIK